MATSTQPASTRTVVLLRPAERKRLEKLAATERVSSGEILRRSLHAYQKSPPASEQEALATLVEDMNTALDGALASLRSARSEIQENLNQIAKMKEARP